jgi:tripartite-type tricarboxylate transporter receptor subunit TctC
MRFQFLRRTVLTVLILAASAMVNLPGAYAQTYPDRPVRLMHGFPAGGNADTIARVLSTSLQLQLGQPFVVEAKAGAGGTIASDMVAKSKADGYTLLLATGGHAIAAALKDNLPYDTEKSFQPVSAVTSFPFLIVVQHASPLRNLQDLLNAGRGKPAPLNYGTAGIGTGQHMTGAFLVQKTRINATHIPFRGDANSITALLGGDVDFVLAPPTAALPHIKAGKLRAIAISGSSRWSALPDVPTVAEQGVRDYDVRSWTALLAPAGTPAPVIARLNAAVRTALSDPAVRQKLEEATGGDVKASSPKELAIAISSDVQRWTQLVKDANIQKE